MRVSDLNFSAHNTFQPAVGTREFGNPATAADTLVTAKPVETGEGFFKRMICCVPRFLTALVQKVLCILTLGFYCNPKPLSEKEKTALLITNAEELHKVWKSAEAPEKKKEAAEAFYLKQPEARNKIIEFGENNALVAAYNLKPGKTDAEIKANKKLEKDWNEKGGHADALTEMNAALDRYDSDLLDRFIKQLKEQNQQAKK